MFNRKGPSNRVARDLQVAFKNNGFKVAAESFEYTDYPKGKLLAKITSWDNYPACMSIYPTVLSKKIYNEETTNYVRA